MTTSSAARLAELGALLGASTGLSLKDLIEQASAPPGEQAEALVSNMRKMEAHSRGVHVDDVPNFVAYPETGFPDDDSKE
jgi:hypothetical protein